MKTYPLHEIVYDIQQFTGLDLNLKVAFEVLYLHKYTELYTELKRSSEKELTRIKEYFDQCIYFPEGTDVPEGYEMLLYEVHVIDKVLRYELIEKFEDWTEENIQKMIAKFRSIDFKTDQAVIFNMKDKFRAGFTQDTSVVN